MLSSQRQSDGGNTHTHARTKDIKITTGSTVNLKRVGFTATGNVVHMYQWNNLSNPAKNVVRKQVEEEMGIPLPAEGEPLPADVEKRISDLVAEAAKRVAVTSQSKAEQERIAAQQQDPLIQMREREVAVKEADVQRKIASDAARIQLDAEKAKNRDEIERERMQKMARAGIQATNNHIIHKTSFFLTPPASIR